MTTAPNPIVHHPGPARFPGDVITDEALREAFGGVAREKFGSTDILLSASEAYNVKDVLYRLGDEDVGLRIIAVRDRPEDTANGHGSEEMDAFLRREMGIGAADPIYALIVYHHPEEHRFTLTEVAEHVNKHQMSQTHMGAYLGQGRTSNAPEEYHGRTWGVHQRGRGYPANVFIVSLTGTDQATLNRNAVLVDACLNEGVEFPGNYKNARHRPIDLNTTLMFYRDWIRGEAYLRDENDTTWWTYCAAHKALVVNVMLNLPHHVEAFRDVYGPDDGTDLFDRFKAGFERRNGRPFTEDDETRFEPLWRKQGLTADRIRPFTKSQYDAYEWHRRRGRLDEYDGPLPVKPSEGTAWAPETTADAVKAFFDVYTPFPRILGIRTCALLVGFGGVVTDRMQITSKTYLDLVMPMMQKVMHADARVRAASNFEEYRHLCFGALYQIFGGSLDAYLTSRAVAPDSRPGDEQPTPEALARLALADVDGHREEIIRDGHRPMDEVYPWLAERVRLDLERARTQLVNPEKETTVQFYIPPAIAHRVAIGLYETEPNPFVSVVPVCTAVDVNEVEQPPEPRETIVTSENADEVAGDILTDLEGAAYYRLPEVLANYLERRFGRFASLDRGVGIAETIITAIDERPELRDRDALAAFLEEQGLTD